jgi:hypothetical protein
LLELDGLATRAAALADLLEMKTLMSGRTASGRH